MTPELAGSGEAPDSDVAQFWEAHYQARPTMSQARANPVLAEVVDALNPADALDLGCGAGGDALWMAGRGWRVTAVDISTTAVDRVAERARSMGLADQVTTTRLDLTRTFPSGSFDLVCASYLHSPGEFPRHRLLRAAAQAVLPGGRLLVVDHGSVAPWSWDQNPAAPFPTPQEVAAELDLDPSTWIVERADTPTRIANGPGGQNAEVIDHVLVLRRSSS